MQTRKFLIVASFFVAHSAAFANDKVCPPTLEPAEQIACLKSYAAILRERLAVKEIEDKVFGGAELGGSSEVLSNTPVVQAVFGTKEQRKAVLYWPSSGTTLHVSENDVIPGGYVVEKIDVNHVVIRSKSGKIMLMIGNAKPLPPQNNIGSFPVKREGA